MPQITNEFLVCRTVGYALLLLLLRFVLLEQVLDVGQCPRDLLGETFRILEIECTKEEKGQKVFLFEGQFLIGLRVTETAMDAFINKRVSKNLRNL